MEGKEEFFPIGAISFFGFLIGFYVFLWLLIYLLLLSFAD
jgi:tetrahydromethanopterin S-methyltransferase subunit F